MLSGDVMQGGACLALADGKPLNTILEPIQAYIERRGAVYLSGSSVESVGVAGVAVDKFALPDVTSRTPFAGGCVPVSLLNPLETHWLLVWAAAGNMRIPMTLMIMQHCCCSFLCAGPSDGRLADAAVECCEGLDGKGRLDR